MEPLVQLAVKQADPFSIVRVRRLCGSIVEIQTCDLIPFPSIVTLVKEHAGCHVYQTFDVVFDPELQKPGFVIARDHRNKDLFEFPVDAVEHADRHLWQGASAV